MILANPCSSRLRHREVLQSHQLKSPGDLKPVFKSMLGKRLADLRGRRLAYYAAVRWRGLYVYAETAQHYRKLSHDYSRTDILIPGSQIRMVSGDLITGKQCGSYRRRQGRKRLSYRCSIDFEFVTVAGYAGLRTLSCGADAEGKGSWLERSSSIGRTSGHLTEKQIELVARALPARP